MYITEITCAITLLGVMFLIYKNITLKTELQILRAENSGMLNQLGQTILMSQKNSIDLIAANIDALNKNVDQKLFNIQQDNSSKLERIRATVEEKLQETLEKRLGESFKIVSERLEQVYKGLGEMQSLAVGVGDLKKVLTNVKTRGIWGEVQLEAILEQIMLPSQFVKNVTIKPGSGDRVEYALKIPSRDTDDSFTLLPIDSKFPLEAYQRLLIAHETGSSEEIAKELKSLESFIKNQAKLISEKYLDPEYTTDFAIMFLPIEGLYAEILRIPGIIEFVQSNYRVVLTSPTTFAAILSSLQLGFRTIAIERRSTEVWKILAVVKSEFLKFADILSRTRTKLDQASKIIGDVETRSRAIQRKLKDVQSVDSKLSDELENLLDEPLDEAA